MPPVAENGAPANELGHLSHGGATLGHGTRRAGGGASRCTLLQLRGDELSIIAPPPQRFANEMGHPPSAWAWHPSAHGGQVGSGTRRCHSEGIGRSHVVRPGRTLRLSHALAGEPPVARSGLAYHFLADGSKLAVQGLGPACRFGAAATTARWNRPRSCGSMRARSRSSSTSCEMAR